MEKNIMMVQENRIDILTTDVLLEVLSRLPMKTLLRFRCVSKQWRYLISNPFFINLQYNQSYKKTLMIQVKLTNAKSGNFEITLVDPLNASLIDKFSLSNVPYFDHKGVRYCSGLLFYFGSNRDFHVCNPFTREFFTITQTMLSKLQSHSLYPYYFPFNSQCLLCASLGYSPSTSQYKIVFLFTSYTEKNKGNNLFTIELPNSLIVTLPNKSDVGTWKYIRVNCLLLKERFLSESINSICVSGIMYWQIGQTRTLLALELGSDKFRVIPYPLSRMFSSDRFDLVELKGKVCMLSISRGDQYMYVWVMKDDRKDLWIKEYTIDYSAMNVFNQCNKREWYWNVTTTPIHVVGDDDGEGKLLIMSSYDGRFYDYNLKAKTFKKLMEISKNEFTYEFVHHGSSAPVPFSH